MGSYERAREALQAEPRTWLVTGVAGFIGSNLLELLLELDQNVVGLDDFSTGRRENLDEVIEGNGGSGARFRFVEGDIRDFDACREVTEGVDYVLHQAALGSVPRSMKDPITTNEVNVGGFLNMLVASRDAGVRRFVYASSSSVYGDDEMLPKREGRVGRPLSPYAASKFIDEQYAQVFQAAFGLNAVGLRYFNVFGRRQDPAGAYAAVIPKWIDALLHGGPCHIYGDGETSRDFCYVDNVLQANILAAVNDAASQRHEVYNVACGERMTLKQLFAVLRDRLSRFDPAIAAAEPTYGDFRPGDVRASHADIAKIVNDLGYEPTHSAEEGLIAAVDWYVANSRARVQGPSRVVG